jgi:hypothetical protein
MRRIWDDSIKEKAKMLRKQGYSYGQLTKELDVAKSTLHQWIRGLKRPQKFSKLDRIRWAKEIQPLGAKTNKKKREMRLLKLAKDVQIQVSALNVTNDIKKTMLVMLYWAEGSKGRQVMQFANIDPRLVLLFITLFRQTYDLDEKKFRIRLHLHYYHREKEIKEFWSKLLKIPTSQFNKTYRKHRSKEKTFRRNFGGICFLKYNSVCLQEEIMHYAYALAEKITGKVNVPVA